MTTGKSVRLARKTPSREETGTPGNVVLHRRLSKANLSLTCLVSVKLEPQYFCIALGRDL